MLAATFLRLHLPAPLAAVCKYAEIDDEYAPTCKYHALRATSAWFGAATAPLLYLIARNWSMSPAASFLVAMLFVLDGLNLGEARLILIDAQLMFWLAAALHVAQQWWARWNAHSLVLERMKAALARATYKHATALAEAEAAAAAAAAPASQGSTAAATAATATTSTRHDAVRSQSAAHAVRLLPAPTGLPAAAAIEAAAHAHPDYMLPITRVAWCVAVAVACTNALSVKFTGLATPGIVGVESFFGLFFLRRPIPLLDLLLIAALSFMLFAGECR